MFFILILYLHLPFGLILCTIPPQCPLFIHLIHIFDRDIQGKLQLLIHYHVSVFPPVSQGMNRSHCTNPNALETF